MSFPSTQNAPKVPAWKRLGLKLKFPASASGGSAQANPSVPDSRPATDATPKRKRPFDDHSRRSSLKKPRKEELDHDISGEIAYQRRKSVSFAQDSKPTSAPGTPKAKASAKPNGKATPKTAKKQKPRKKGPPKEDRNPVLTAEDTLEYLRRWKTSKETWKFSTNHQTHLLQNAFDSALLPANDIDTLYDYIHGLKGLARRRLLETAREVIKGDKFPDGTKDVEPKEKEYQDIMSRMLQPNEGPGSKRKYYSEMEFTSTVTSANGTVTSRVVKRMRAEIIIDDLMDTMDGASDLAANKESGNANAPAVADANGGKRGTGNDGAAGPPAKRIRASKKRTGGDSSSSSSETDGDDDEEDDEGSSSDTSSSDDSDSDSDDAMDVNQELPETSSSSSSSSEEESGSEEDSEDDGEDDEDGDEEMSEDDDEDEA